MRLGKLKFFAWAALALSSNPAALGADLELGEYLSAECTTCHQPGSTSEDIPAIEGWPAPFMLMVLEQYRSGERQNPVMRSVVNNLDNEELAAVSAWFEQAGKPQ